MTSAAACSGHQMLWSPPLTEWSGAAGAWEHAYGDRAVRLLIDVYEKVLDRNPWLPPNSLVIEHGGLASAEQRARP